MENNANSNCGFLTGIILGHVKYCDSSHGHRIDLLNHLIKAHTEYPIAASDTFVTEAIELRDEIAEHLREICRERADRFRYEDGDHNTDHEIDLSDLDYSR